ncbi:MAG TPA: hypothetical protein DCR40_04260 [Prolixibacteraceae bacterium]|nr:hypothetical protein [Prolixibacteraceae bacterium]
MESLIPKVKTEATSSSWMNKKVAEFKYNATQVWYQLIELTPDEPAYIINPSERNEENCPVMVLGFTAYLIHNWGKSETEMYKGFYELCLADFINKEEKLPGAFKRDLKAEYYRQHIEEENARVAYSKKIYPYLTNNDCELIRQFTESYFEFIKKEYVKQPQTQESSDLPEQPSLPEKEQSKSEELKLELDKIRSSENLFWKGLPMDKVISHFTVMTTKKSKNGNEFLTTKQLISFLRKGFLNDTTQPKQKINCSNGEKGFVIKRFYELFDIAVAHYGHIQNKRRFIKLFTECFDNWGEKSIPSFFKPGKTINKW